MSAHSLRVVVVWRSTVLEEKTFTQTSSPTIYVGEGERNHFGVDAAGLPETYEMFERTDDGYTVRFTNRVDGKICVGDEAWTLDELIDAKRAWRVERVRTLRGDANSYEIELSSGDWGRLKMGDVDIFFQLIEQAETIAGRGLGSVEWPAVGMVLLAGLLHGAVLLTAFLSYEADASMKGLEIPDKFVDISVDDVPGLQEPEEDDVPSEDTSGKRAGGEEGKFGEPDTKVADNEIPKNDGQMVEQVDPTKIGVVDALATTKLGGGAITQIFADSQGFSNKLDVAMSGDDEGFRPGRGVGGMGMRGLERGGGGDGTFGRLQAVGEIDSGGGPGTGAKLRKKKAKRPDGDIELAPPRVGDFCDKSDIRRVVSAKANAIKYCYERQLQQEPELAGKVIAQWKVGLDGKVSDATVVKSTVHNRAVEGCIARTIGRMRFAKPDGGICVINYPFVFSGLR